MKTTIFRRKTTVFLGAAAVLLAAVFTAGCSADVNGEGKQPLSEKVSVAMTAGANGSISASPALPPDKKVAKDTEITFSATAAAGFSVDRWTITGGKTISGGMNGDKTATVKITADSQVFVTFKPSGNSPPAQTSFTVAMTAGANGSISASPALPEDKKVAKDTEITFSATAAAGFSVDRWTITGGKIISGGMNGDSSARVKVTANVTVSVAFISGGYTKVPFQNLDAYLRAAPSEGVNAIEVTGLEASYLKGFSYGKQNDASALGKILNSNGTKKVSLKLGGSISGLTDMLNCFYGCKTVVQVSEIPAGVTNMSGCFTKCASLMNAPTIPESVQEMRSCFFGCSSLSTAPAMPKNVQNMLRCFDSCTSLTRAPEIPEGVLNMEDCFYNCTSLMDAPAIPESVQNMDGCFDGCIALTTAPVIRANIKQMLVSFRGCTSLTKAPAIPASVQDMRSCFLGCSSLTKAPTIPKNVRNMRSCFEGCKKLTSAELKCMYNPAELNGKPAFKDVFKDCAELKAGSITVPTEGLDAYKENAGMMGAQRDWFKSSY